MNDMTIADEQIRVLDIMEQVKKLNAMIDLHQTESKDAVMVSQYEDMKRRFLIELKDIMLAYQIEVQIQAT